MSADLLAISNLPWDTYFPPGVGPPLAPAARTHVAPDADEIARWLAPAFSDRIEGEGVGGSPTNAALAFAGLGGAATVVGPVASDAWGARVRADVRRHGAALVEIEPAPSRQAHSLAFRQDNGERLFLASFPCLAAGAGARGVRWEGPGWIASSAYELRDPEMRRIVVDGFAEARAGGRQTAFDLADPNFVRHSREAVERILEPGADVLLAGIEALSVLLDRAPGEISAGRLSAVARTVLITMGGEGVRVCHEGRDQLFPAGRGEVFDTTGAGDAFLGAFLLGRTRRMEVSDAVRLGLAVAGEVVRVRGVRVPEERWGDLRREWGFQPGS